MRNLAFIHLSFFCALVISLILPFTIHAQNHTETSDITSRQSHINHEDPVHHPVHKTHNFHQLHSHFFDISQVQQKHKGKEIEGQRIRLMFHGESGFMAGGSFTQTSPKSESVMEMQMQMEMEMEMTMIHIGQMKQLTDNSYITTLLGGVYMEEKQSGSIVRKKGGNIRIGVRRWLSPSFDMHTEWVSRHLENSTQSGLAVTGNYIFSNSLALVGRLQRLRDSREMSLSLRYHF